MRSRNNLIAAISLLTIFFATPSHAQTNDTLDMRMPVYDDMMLASPEKTNPDTFFYHVATRKHADLTEEFALYYDDYVHRLSIEAFEQEVEHMKAAARRYRSKALEFETDYLSVNLPHGNYSDMDRIAATQDLLKRAEASGNLIPILRARQYLIMHSYYTSQFHLFFSNAIKQLEDLEKISATDYPGKHACYYYIGRAYYDFGDYDRAIPILHKALDEGNTLTRKFHDRHSLMAYNTLGAYFSNHNQHDSAEYYFRAMLKSPDRVKYRPMYDCIAIASLGYIANSRRQYDKALRLLSQAMPVSLAQGDISFAIGIATGMGEAYLEKGELRQTKTMIDSIYALLKRCDSVYWDSRLRAFYPLLSKYCAHTGDKHLSAAYLDSTLAVNKRLEEKYNVMLLLRADQEDHQAQQERKEQQIRLRERTLTAVFGIMLLLALALSIILYLYRKRQIAYRALFRQIKEQDRLAATAAAVETRLIASLQSPQHELVARLRNYLLSDRNFAKPDMNRDQLIAALATNRTTLSEALKTVTGKTLTDYIHVIRLEEARQILETRPQLTVEAIAEACGFNSSSAFYQLFRKCYNISPAEYRKIARKQG
jgi:AraC-like DNA-binding protein